MLNIIAVIFAAGLIANMLVVQKAEIKLLASQRTILDNLSNSRTEKLFPLIVIGVAIYLLTRYIPTYAEWIFISGVAITLLYLWVTHFLTVKRLRNAGLPDNYVRAVLLGGYFYLVPVTFGGAALYLWNIKIIS